MLFLKRKLSLPRYRLISPKQQPVPLSLELSIPRNQILTGNRFIFLNKAHDFPGPINWEFQDHGKLWCYNLNYFDFLNQPGMSAAAGMKLIFEYISAIESIETGLDPYPTSLRIINWIKFISRHSIQDSRIDDSLFSQADLLAGNIEYHLRGNHLLENSFALLYAAYYFEDQRLYAKARHILAVELDEQVLPDGGHFELSPMYHQILLDRLLDCVNLVKNNKRFDGDLLQHLTAKASIMLGWLDQMTFENGDMPLVNDAAFNIAPVASELIEYAKRLSVDKTTISLKESGYRKIKKERYELLADVGDIGPDYIPGHAHSDTLNFLLYIDRKPFIVDTGISTYEPGELRLNQRRTAAHNTVQIDGLEQSEVWSSFRVARRAKVNNREEDSSKISAVHDGYNRINVLHKRAFTLSDSLICINDEIVSDSNHSGAAFFHFHPEIDVRLDGSSAIAGGRAIRFTGADEINLKPYQYAPEFNRLVPGLLIQVDFRKSLRTEIYL